MNKFREAKFMWIIVFLLGAAVWLHHPLRGVVFAVLRLPLTIVESVLSTVFELPHLPALARENALLRSELTAQRLQVVQLRETLRHLTRAAELKQAVQTGSGRLATIIGRTIVPTQQTVLLNIGSREGLARDGPLLDAAGVVGRVVEVRPTTSLAMLLTDPDSRVACLVERSRESALLVGTGEFQCQLLDLDVDADVVVEDRVVTAGLGGPFPKGLLLGTVVKVVRDERNARLRVWVRPAVALKRLEEVLCLPPEKPSTVHRP